MKLYKVKYASQNADIDVEKYIIADSMQNIEAEIADIISVEPLYFEDIR